MKEGKITIAEIKAIYPFNDTTLASLAEVNPIVLQKMLGGEPVERLASSGSP